MHDLMEGVIPHKIKLLLHYCLSKRYFELLTFNQRLTAFDLGYSEVGDKPALVENSCNMRQSASQMWLLIRIFPVLLGDLIPTEDSHWQCFLKPDFPTSNNFYEGDTCGSRFTSPPPPATPVLISYLI